jgi:uncharacterized phiE125 gp8 family phage protein
VNLRPKAWPKDLSPPEEPLTLAECYTHLRVDPDEDSDGNLTHPDDALILGMLTAAREHAERFTGMTIAARLREVAFDSFPEEDADALELGTWPVVELSEVVWLYAGAEVVSSTSDSFDVELDDHAKPAAVVVAYGASWPASDERPNAVRVRFLAGFQSATDSTSEPLLPELPGDVRAAVLLTLGHLYANRESTVDKAMSELPFGIDALLRPHRHLLGMA